MRAWYPLRERGYSEAKQGESSSGGSPEAATPAATRAKVSTYVTAGKNKALGEVELVLKWRHNAEQFQASLLAERRRKHEEAVKARTARAVGRALATNTTLTTLKLHLCGTTFFAC